MAVVGDGVGASARSGAARRRRSRIVYRVGKGFPGRAMPYTLRRAYGRMARRTFDTVQMPDAEAAVAEAIARARSIRVAKPENGWVAEGRALLARAHLKSVAWPFGASFGTLGAGMSRDGWPQLRSDVARRVG